MIFDNLDNIVNEMRRGSASLSDIYASGEGAEQTMRKHVLLCAFVVCNSDLWFLYPEPQDYIVCDCTAWLESFIVGCRDGACPATGLK